MSQTHSSLICANVGQPLQGIDWSTLKSMDGETALGRLTAIVRHWDGAEEKAFAVRGMVALLMEERELWKMATDPETEQPYSSLDEWFRKASPISHSSWRDAMRTIKELHKDVPLEMLMRIKRCNLEHMKQISSGVRKKSDVQRAAVDLPEKKFVEEVNRAHPDQHLEARQPVIMADKAVSEKRDEAIEIAKKVYNCTNDGEALEAIFADFIDSHAVEYEHMRESAA